MSDLQSKGMAAGADRTEHQDADERLCRSEERFRAMVENLPAGAIYVDARDGSVYLSKAASAITGYKRDELPAGDRWIETLFGDATETIRAMLDPGDQASSHASRTYPIVRRDGNPRQVEVTVYKDDRCAVWLLNDVSDRESARNLLHQRTHELGERVKELKCFYDISHLVEKYGVSSGQILQGVAELIPPALQYPRSACARITVDGLEFKTKRFATTPWKLSTNIFINEEPAGSLEAYYVEEKPELDEGPFLQEERRLLDAVGERLGRIIERNRAEERQRLLTRVVEQAAESILIMDTEGKIEYVNPAFEAMSGYAPNEVLGRHPRIFRDVNPEFYDDLWERVRGGENWEGRLVSKRKNGTRYEEEGTVSAVRNDRGEIVRFVEVMRDVTDLIKLESGLRQAQKMEAIGQLAGGVAHDFNNLLTVILTNCHYLLKAVDESSPLRQDVEEIKQSGERAASLTRQLLAFSRRQVVEPVVVDLNQVLVGIEKMLGRVIGEDIELATNPAAHLDRVFVDLSQVEQVILNLAVNARDAMPDGGNLTLGTENVVLSDEYARLRNEVQPGRYVVLSVADSGCGMDEVTRSRIFEPFFTTKEPGKGTGLGLASVYGIVRQSGGHIGVHSEVGEGTVFKVYFPMVEEEVKSGSAQPPSEPSLKGSGTILVVEDDDLVRQTAGRILRDHEYTVLEACDGKEALEVCGRHSAEIDLMITDVVMPKMGGNELADLVADKYPGIKFLFMSGYAKDGTGPLQDMAHSGGAFVRKPLGPSDLAQKVRELLDENGEQEK